MPEIQVTSGHPDGLEGWAKGTNRDGRDGMFQVRSDRRPGRNVTVQKITLGTNESSGHFLLGAKDEEPLTQALTVEWNHLRPALDVSSLIKMRIWGPHSVCVLAMGSHVAQDGCELCTKG